MTAPLSGPLLAATAWSAIALLSPVLPGIYLLSPDSGAQPGMKVK